MMKKFAIRLLIQCYPYAWRERYAVEFEAMLEQYQFRLRDFADVLIGAVDARLHYHRRKPTPKWAGQLTSLMISGIVMMLSLLTFVFMAVAVFVVPPPTSSNTTWITGTLLSATSPCCDDLVIRLHEYQTAFYFNRRGGDQEMVNQLFQSGETVSIMILKRDVPISNNPQRSTPAFALESEAGTYYAPALTTNAFVDYRVYYAIVGLITGSLTIAIIYAQSWQSNRRRSSLTIG